MVTAAHRSPGPTALLVSCAVLTTLAGSAQGDEEAPAWVQVTGTIRDFKGKDEVGGHPDFALSHAEGRYSGNVAELLGVDHKLIYTGAGRKVTSQWRDANHRPICFRLYDSGLGDLAGHFGQAGSGQITDQLSFDQWYRDTIGINLSMPLTITLIRQADGHYVFDDTVDPNYQDLGGFFPIDDQLFGNTPGQSHNFHFTYELHLEFEYDADGDQFFTFVGDDDIWVFIDERCVIDLGGVHASLDQYVDLTRLDLTDGETYSLDFFFAERRRMTADFRIETNLILQDSALPMLSLMAYD